LADDADVSVAVRRRGFPHDSHMFWTWRRRSSEPLCCRMCRCSRNPLNPGGSTERSHSRSASAPS